MDRALSVNPNLATTWYMSGWLRVWLGESDLAIKHFAQFARMSPVDPFSARMQAGCAFAHALAGRYEEAVTHAEQALRETPNSQQALRIGALSYGLAGRMEQAESTMTRLREIDPALRVSNLKEQTPLRGPENMAKYVEGLRKAGLPE
jgi:tetratricopeptide (TPR) repeat protein